MSIKKALIGTVALIGAAIAGTQMANAAGGAKLDYDWEHPHWHFKGPFGTYDRAAMQRGYQVYREVCASCHQLKFLAFRHLGDKNAPYYSKDYPNPNDNPYVKAFAADWMIEDIDPDTGDVIERPGIPADKFPAIYPNPAAAAASNGGAIPPELSAIVKARGQGADYIYNLLVAYDAHKPDDYELSPGTYYNPVMDGGAIAMAAPLSDGLVTYEPIEYTDKKGNVVTIPAPEATVDQMARDVTEFLAWTADPKMEQRKSLGLSTMIYLAILSLLLFFSYKTVWKDVKH